MTRSFWHSLVIVGFVAAFVTPAAARTFKVVDTSTGERIAGAEVHVIARGIVPIPLPHPGETTLGEWRLQTDAQGEARLDVPFEPHSWIVWVSKERFDHVDTLRERAYRELAGSDPDTLFLTPKADALYETIQLQYQSLSRRPVTRSGDPLPWSVAVEYGLLRKQATTPREIGALRQFCSFTELMEGERANSWKGLGTLVEVRRGAEQLIEDCKAPAR